MILLIGVVAFFLTRLIAQLDKTTQTVDTLSLNFAVYLGHADKSKDEFESVKKKLSLVNKRLIELKFKAESAGWKFRPEDWDIIS